MSAGGPRKVWYLRRIDLFAGMTEAEVEELCCVLDDVQLPAGAELLHDRRRDRAYLVKEGAVRLYAREQGEEVTLALLGPGRLFGLSASVGEPGPAVDAMTLEPAYICFASWDRLLEALIQRPPVLLGLVHRLAEQLFVAEAWIQRFQTTLPQARLADLLLELSAEFGEPDAAGGRRLRFRLTQADLARMVGLSRETVSRLLAEFARQGWVVREGGRLLVRDQPALAALARRPAHTPR
jgi:CRP-like cAMP-binding protein